MKRYRVTIRETRFAEVVVEASSKGEAQAIVQRMDDDEKLRRLDFHPGDRLVGYDVEIERDSFPPNEDDIPY